MSIYSRKFQFFLIIIFNFFIKYSSESNENNACDKATGEEFLPNVQDSTEYRKWENNDRNFLVMVVWFNTDSKTWDKRLGCIISEYIILTADVYGLIENDKRSGGFCLFSFSMDIPSTDIIRWRKWRRYIRQDDPIEYAITLIELDEKIIWGIKYCFLNFYMAEYPLETNDKSYMFAMKDNDTYYRKVVNLVQTQIDEFFKSRSKKPDDLLLVKLAQEDKCQENTYFERGSPVVFRKKLIGLFYQGCDDGAKSLPFSNIRGRADWINAQKRRFMIEKYPYLTGHVVFYGEKNDQQFTIKGIATILSDKFIITNYIRNAQSDTGYWILPKEFRFSNSSEITKDAIPFDKVYAFNNKRSSSISLDSGSQLTVIKLKRDIDLKNQKEKKKVIFLNSKYPLAGSKCFVITALNNYNKHVDFTYDYNLHFSPNDVKLVQIEIALWKYADCKEYYEKMQPTQFCFLMHHTIDEGNHCHHIMGGSPVFCDSLFMGVVNDVNDDCKQEKPRRCTNIYDYKKWIENRKSNIDIVAKAKEHGYSGIKTSEMEWDDHTAGGGNKCEYSVIKIFFALINSIAA
uniref:Uncharacterized protein n=1 Tax=Glossina brevipalpis TaxID=37001 RepID=A0A1A9WJT1_9MUSC